MRLGSPFASAGGPACGPIRAPLQGESSSRVLRARGREEAVSSAYANDLASVERWVFVVRDALDPIDRLVGENAFLVVREP